MFQLVLSLIHDDFLVPQCSLEAVDGSVFDECVALYAHVQAEMLVVIQQHVTSEVRARFMPYKRDKWFVEHKR